MIIEAKLIRNRRLEPDDTRQDEPALPVDDAADDADEPDDGGQLEPTVDGAVEHHVVDGEIVDDEGGDVEWDELPAYLKAAVIVREAAASDAAQTAARNASYIVVGAETLWRRRQETRGTARHERMMNAAEATGNHEAALKWAELAAQTIADRHARRMDRAERRARHLERLPLYAKGTGGGLTGIGVLLAVAERDVRMVVAPFLTAAELVQWLITLVVLVQGPVLLGSPVLALFVLWVTGRRNIDASDIGWVQALNPSDSDRGIIVSADGIVQALQHLRIPELKKAFKDGWIPKMHLTPIRDGRGYHAVVELPLGVTPEMVCDLRPVLARNLYRAEIETWPSDAEKAGTGPAGSLDLWIADSGALTAHAPEYPLLHEGTADVFDGVPAGISPRGDVITIPLVSNNFVAGGMMGQGKSNACRVIMLGAALDPLCRLWVHVFAGNGDFDAYRPRLERYHRGATDDVTEAGLQSLRDLYEEVARRENRLSELGAKKLTRQLAQQHSDLRPIAALFSECHELFSHKEYGEEAVELATKTLRRARKTGIWMGFDTQDARKDAIPPKIVSLVSINACFYVKTWKANDGFLGDGSFQAGIRATKLRPKRDRGTSLITGVTDAMFELLKWHFVEVDDDTGWDAAEEAIARAMKVVDPHTPVEESAVRKEIERRDLLEDLEEAFKGATERVKVSDLPARLREIAPSWYPYKTITGADLKVQLRHYGVRITNTGNVARVDPADFYKAVMQLSTEDLDEE